MTKKELKRLIKQLLRGQGIKVFQKDIAQISITLQHNDHKQGGVCDPFCDTIYKIKMTNGTNYTIKRTPTTPTSGVFKTIIL